MSARKGELERWQQLRALLDAEPTDGCVEWWGARSAGGYGSVWFEGRNYRAHRLLLTWVSGRELDARETVMHSCDNPPCVNPAHLSIGDQSKNMSDCVARGRMDRSGESNGRAKLSENDIRDIRQRYVLGGSRRLAEEYGVHPSNIRAIITRKKWAHVN